MTLIRKFLLFLLIFKFTGFCKELRIVSLGPYVTENLVLLGLEKNIVGLTVHDLPERRKNKEIIGTLWEPNIEKILSLKPDYVIGSKEGNKPQAIEKIKKYGIKVIVLDQLYTFSDICKNFIYLGEKLGKKKEAEKIVKDIKERIEKIRVKDKKIKVFFIIGIKPLITTGGNFYINEMIEYAGGINIFNDINKKFFEVSVEEVIKRNPDIIFYLEMDGEIENIKEKLKNTDAVKNNKIYSLPTTQIASPTPLSFLNSIELLKSLMYP